MGEGFNKFKRKIYIELIIKSIVFGLSLGLVSFSILLILNKVEVLKIQTLFLILIGIGLALLGGGLFFLVFKPNKKKIAKRIDENLNLSEQTQTVVDYENCQGDVVDCLKEENNKVLLNTPSKNLKYKVSIALIAAAIIGVGLTTTSALIPSASATNPSGGDITSIPDDPNDGEYELDDYSIVVIKQLIEYVKASPIDDEQKNRYVTELEALIENLRNCEKESQMRTYALRCINNVIQILEDVNTNVEVGTYLKRSLDSDIVDLAGYIVNLDISNFRNQMDLLNAKINSHLLEEMEEIISLFQMNFSSLTVDSTLDPNEELTKGLLDFSNSLSECLEATDIKGSVTNKFTEWKSTLTAILTKQKNNFDVEEHVETTLRELFSLVETNNGDGDSGNGDGGNNGESGDQGGAGNGEVIAGNGDNFYDPEQGDVSYGDVINQYRQRIEELYADGKISEELMNYYLDYLNALIGAEL